MVLYCGPQFSLARAFDMRSCYSALSHLAGLAAFRVVPLNSSEPADLFIYSKMKENTLLFCRIVNWPQLPRSYLQNSKEYLAYNEATRAN